MKVVQFQKNHDLDHMFTILVSRKLVVGWTVGIHWAIFSRIWDQPDGRLWIDILPQPRLWFQ